jgi:aminoglycoside phosphotransferase (APT) family kinase protein
MSAPIIGDFSPATLLAAVAAEELPIDLSRAAVNDAGWENVVLETSDGWIVRFPRDEDVQFDRELRVLDLLRDRLLPVSIPVVVWSGRYTRCAVYRRITGAAFDRAGYLTATEEQREALASSLARFLAAMHDALTPAEIKELELPTLDFEPTLELVVRELRWLPPAHWRDAEGLIGEFAATWVAGTVIGSPVPVHNDFHTGNMAFAAPVGDLTGVWDFSNVALASPSFDLRYLDSAPRDLLERVAGHYQMLTLRPVDLRAAVVANRMEDLFDVLETRRMDLFEAAVVRWRQADSGG